MGRGSHSSAAFQLNLSALYGIGGARRGCEARLNLSALYGIGGARRGFEARFTDVLGSV